MKTWLQQVLQWWPTPIIIQLLAMGIIGFVFKPDLLWRILVYFFSGRAFTNTQIVTGGALDQGSLHKGFFLFCLSSALAAPAVWLAAWITKRQARPDRAWFRLLSFPLFLLPFTILTITFIQVLRYMSAMGYTPMRLAGILFSLVSYIALLASFFECWSFRLKTKTGTNP